MNKPVIVWFRKDLRLTDNPALLKASKSGKPVLPVYIWAPEEEGSWPPGEASNWWLHQSLKSLDESLSKLGHGLKIFRSDDSLAVLRDLIKKTEADAVFWNRRYEPHAIERDKRIKSELKEDGTAVESFNSYLLFEPWEIENNSGDPYKVYTPFWKACRSRSDGPAPPAPRVEKSTWYKLEGHFTELKDLELEPKINWSSGMESFWIPGEKGAQKRLNQFLDSAILNYSKDRDEPAKEGVSYLSPHLHFGEIGPRQIWHAVLERCESSNQESLSNSEETYLKEVVWREFAYHVLYHFPETTHNPMRESFECFPWTNDRKYLKAWQRGNTGYPIVDAGMRQLWHTGWMHNRVRMIVASFLTKDLLVSWRHGAAWFWDTLVDADLASNTFGWQWTAGCGADAAPYFRIFNPTLQGKKFDPDGKYIRKWVPELQKLPDKYIHSPAEAPEDVLKKAGVTLGKNYPEPIVDHGKARDEALAIYADIKS